MIGKIAVTGRLAGLALESLELGLERRHHVLEPFEVVVRRPQPEFRLVAARMKPGDARGFLQKPPPVGGPGVDQGADLTLVHQRRRSRSRGGVGEQQLDVPRAHLGAVDPVGGAAAALDLAGHLDFVLIVEGGGRHAVGIVEKQGNFGDVARRSVGGAAEDHVVHLAAAQFLRRQLAHHPTQGLDEVGLAAAVGADDPGEPGIDPHLGRINEGFEPRQAKLQKLHRRALDISYCCFNKGSKIFSNRAKFTTPGYFLPLMMKLGVESMANSFWASSRIAMTRSSNALLFMQASKSFWDMPPSRPMRARAFTLSFAAFQLSCFLYMVSMNPKYRSRPAQRAIIEPLSASLSSGKSR